ncbi:MAG: DNA/RNA non-specific endonuclease [Pirellulaceae bacterium]|nr:DNA/RNA non-specific endonuclease [Pirellulaceae bacterium]
MSSGNSSQNFFARFGQRFAPPPAKPSGLSGFESAFESAAEAIPEADFSEQANAQRMERAEDSLDRIVREYLKADPSAVEIANRIRREGGDALERLGQLDPRLADDAQAGSVLEVIVATDGSRPTFLIKNGQVDPLSSVLGTWGDKLTTHSSQLEAAIACVGRIDHPAASLGYMGTGFLVQPDLVVTNRHVLQAIGAWNGRKWQLASGIAIDFGHEWNATSTLNRRLVDEVVFATPKAVNPYQIDHSVLDLAILRLKPTANPPKQFFQLTTSKTWMYAGGTIFTIGYPGPPPATVPQSLLEQLFKSQYGYKRLAPGVVMPAGPANWTLAHDATTLGGNSGSVIISIDANGFAAGLHYGGQWSTPRENWGHILADVLDQPDQASGLSLREVLQSYGATVRTDLQAPAAQPITPIPPQTTSRSPSKALPAYPVAVSTTLPAAAVPASGTRSQAGSVSRPTIPLSSRFVTLDSMKFLGVRPGATRAESVELEAAGDGETPASVFEDRGGYDPEFLPGWTVLLPKPDGDMRHLRRGGTGTELKYQHFSVILSASRRMPIITATNIDGAQSRRVPRIDTWRYDGRLDQADQWGNELYTNNALDRGHMVRREDPVWGSLEIARRANIDTFHYTNSCPQMAGVNQRVWLGLEDYILKHTRQDDMRISVFGGPYFSDDDLEYRGALIPLAFWKVVAFQVDGDRPSATAYKVSQVRELSELEFVFSAYKTFQISIQQVMDATGIDFSDLIPFDGFSTHEATHGGCLSERIEDLSQIRV